MGDHMNYVMTLANSIIGVGVLAMPFCFQKCGIVLAILMILLSSVISRLSCHFLLKASIYARRKNFEFLAFHALGSTGKLLVELGIIGFLMGTVIAFFVVVGDLGPEIIAKTLNIESTQSLRSWLLIFITIGCVLPLGLLRNVDSLTSICTVTIGFYVCLVLKVIVESTKHISDSDWMDKVEIWKPSGILQCLPIFSMALFCQTQIFEIYSSMENASLEKMNLVVKWAINICAIVYILVGSFGYIAFCHQHFSGNILLSFSPTPMSDIIKMGFVLSVAFSFPLAIFPCRASLYSLLFRRVTSQHELPVVMPERRFRCLTVLIVAVGLAVAMALPSIEVVLGLVGSTMGVAVCVLLPAACYVKIVTRQNNERLLAQIVLVIGILIMVFGTYANLYAMDEANSNMNFEKIDSEVKKVDEQKSKIDELSDIVNEKILMVPLEDLKNKLPVDKILHPIDIVLNNDKKPIREEIKTPIIVKVEEVHKEPIIPPLPIEKDELMEVDKINKEKSLSEKEKDEILPNKKEEVKTEKKIATEMKLNNAVKELHFGDTETNIAEISKDAIKKEDQELGLDKTNGIVKDILKKSDDLSEGFNKKQEEIPVVEVSRDSFPLKAEINVETINEGRAIQDIKKEKMQLDNEFQRKVVENMDLIANMNKKTEQNIKKVDSESIVNEVTKSVSNMNYVKKDAIVNKEHTKHVINEVPKYEKVVKVTSTLKPLKKVNVFSAEKTLDESNIPLRKVKTMADLNPIQFKNLTKGDSVPPIMLFRNYTDTNNKLNNNIDRDKSSEKFLQRDILEAASENIQESSHNPTEIVHNKVTERIKRDLDHELTHTNEQNCIKNEIINENEADSFKIPSQVDKNKVNIIINHEFSEVLKSSSRDLKSIPDKVEDT